ncbi:hypothetical protein ACTOB_003051 [Actinoplanes oblitus]|uniref:Uncharacterized protein n=1 Tax=Actinoplanes oblitus TaxID=3040509 RepID=A0ABY8WNI5_9ACTN|nr:hypothetical protein [Actinoplanes oblitus]WIM99400.1 hypothetical protein ACTOB_003051 [Actinoplanes oblitus]
MDDNDFTEFRNEVELLRQAYGNLATRVSDQEYKLNRLLDRAQNNIPNPPAESETNPE